jgi:uncharacterized protein YbaP (TraB family)
VKIPIRNYGQHTLRPLFIYILILTLTGLLLSSFVLTGSCAVITGEDENNRLEENGKSFIWKISSSDSYVYLLGSIHYGKPEFYPLSNAIENAFEDSDKLVLETDFTGISFREKQLTTEKYGRYPEGEELKDNLRWNFYIALSDYLQENGIDISFFDDYRPWVVYEMVDEIKEENWGYYLDYGIDFHFQYRTYIRNMEIIGLETFDEHVKVLSNVPEEDMINLLERIVLRPDFIDQTGLFFDIWEDGDAEILEAWQLEWLERYPDMAVYYDILLTERNFNWMPKIEEFLADEHIYFIVVGLSHLLGEDGLLDLLDEKGYEIEQL